LADLIRTRFYIRINRQYVRISNKIADSNADASVKASNLNAIHSYFTTLAREGKTVVTAINREPRITARQRRTLLGQVRSIGLMITLAFWATIPHNHQDHYHRHLPEALQTILKKPPRSKYYDSVGTGGASTMTWNQYPDRSLVCLSSGDPRQSFAQYVVLPFLVKLLTKKKFVPNATVQ